MKTENLEKLERDTMPPQVALEMLCEPRARMTNRMRKNCRAARETHYISTTEALPAETRIAAKLKSAKIAQLGRWLRRSISRRPIIQRAYLRVTGATPLHDRVRAALSLRAGALEMTRDAIEDELTARAAKQEQVAEYYASREFLFFGRAYPGRGIIFPAVV